MSDIKKLKKLYSEYKKIKGYDEGGEVEDKDSTETDSSPQPTPTPRPAPLLDPAKALLFEQGMKQQFADGGKVPQKYSLGYSDGGVVHNVDFEDPSTITSSGDYSASELPQQDNLNQPTSQEKQSDLDKQLEDDYSDESEPEQPSNEEGSTDEEQSEESTGSRLLASLKPAQVQAQGHGMDPNALKDAQAQRDRNIMGADLERYGALVGSGISKTDPTLMLQMAKEHEKNANMPVQKYEEQIQNQQYDPSSSMSQVMRQYLTSKGIDIAPNASAADVLKVAPYLAKDASLQNAWQKALMTDTRVRQVAEANRNATNERSKSRDQVILDSAQKRADAMKSGQDNTNKRQEQRLAAKFIKDLQMDPIAKPSMQNLASLDKSQKILENKAVPLTPQLLSDAEQDISSALTLRGQGATEGKIKRTELITLGRKLAEAKQRYLNQPNVDLRKSDPALVSVILKMNKALKDDYTETIKQRKNDLAKEYEPAFGDSPLLKKTIDQYRTPETSQQFTPDVTDYATQHGISPEQALSIKNQRTGR